MNLRSFLPTRSKPLFAVAVPEAGADSKQGGECSLTFIVAQIWLWLQERFLSPKLPRDESAVEHGLGASSAMDEARDHALELIAPGETGEVVSGMIGSDLAVRSGDRALDIAERRIHPFEWRHAARFSTRAGANCPMAACSIGEHAPAAEAVVTSFTHGAWYRVKLLSTVFSGSPTIHCEGL